MAVSNILVMLAVISFIDAKGDIAWHSSENGKICSFCYNKIWKTLSDINYIVTDLQDDSSRLYLHLFYEKHVPTPSPSSSKQSAANILLLVVGLFFAGVTFQSSRSLVCVFVIFLSATFITTMFAHEQSTGVNIHIYVPKNFSFKSVSLTSLIGSIKSDNDLVSIHNITCTSGQQVTECPSCCSGNGNCTGGTCICGIGYQNGTEDCAQQTGTTLNYYSNPSDPIILAANAPDGDTIYMIGEKDSDGNPINIERFYKAEPDGNTTYTILNENNTITSARHSSGMTMNFNWNENSTEVYLDVIVPELQQQVTITINLLRNDTNSTELDEFDELTNEEDSISKRDIRDSYIGKNRRRSSDVSEIDETNVIQDKKLYKIKRNAQPSNSARVSVSVESCGSPENNAIVQADVTQGDTTNQYNGKLSATPGLYYIHIPTKTSISEVAEDVCDKIEMALDKACSWYDKVNKVVKLFSKHSLEKLLCFYLGKGLQLIPQLRLIPIYKFCKQIFKGINYYCDKINAPVVNGLEIKKSELICDLIAEVTDTSIDPLLNTSIHFAPFAILSNGRLLSGTGRDLTLQPGTSQLPTTFNISDNSILQIHGLTFNPPDPRPHQRYIATAEYACFTPSTVVTMNIVGTDGYTNAITCIGGPTCNLSVPGAEALVRDVVTASAFDSTTQQFAVLEATIIF